MVLCASVEMAKSDFVKSSTSVLKIYSRVAEVLVRILTGLVCVTENKMVSHLLQSTDGK